MQPDSNAAAAVPAIDRIDPGVIASVHPQNGFDGSGSPVGMQNLLDALQAVRVGDFSVRLPGNQTGLAGKVADTFNEIVAANERMAHQLEQVGQVVGKEGKTRKRVKFG